MIFVLSTILIAVGTYFLQLFLPWYSVAVFPFVIGLILQRKGIPAFFTGFLAIGLLWGVLAYLIHYQTDGVLTGRLAALLQVNSNLLVILLTAVAGGLTGGLWSLAGYHCKRIFVGKKKKDNRYEFS